MEIEFPDNRWPITSDMEMSVEHFEDIRKAIFRRWKGLGKWPFCHETYLDREMQYSDFNYFTYQFGGDGYYRHGIEGDNFSGHHYWQYYQWPGLTKDWIEGGRVGDKPSATEKTPYNLRDMPHHGTWVYLGLQQRWQEGAGIDEREWNNMPIWTPAWSFLPMQVKYWEEEDYQMRQQRQELNWWIAWYHWGGYFHSRPDPNDANADEFCYISGNKYNPSSYENQYIDDSWQPCFQHYQAAIDNLATQITWADWFDAPTRGYWPDPDEPQEAYSDWKDVKNMVRGSWPTKSVQGYDYPTCGATDYHGYFLQNRLDYFLWLAEENGDIEVDLWLHLIQKGSDETEWVIRPYWKMHNCDRDGEMSTHVLDDFKEVLKLMRYRFMTGGLADVTIQVSLSFWTAGCSGGWSKCKQLADVAASDYLAYKNGTSYSSGDSGYDCFIVGAGIEYRNKWQWSWPSAEGVVGAYITLGESSTQPNSDCSGWEAGSPCSALLRFSLYTLTAGSTPGDGNCDSFILGGIVARHWKWRSVGGPNTCWVGGNKYNCEPVGVWSETACKLIGRTTFGGLPYPSSGARCCTDRDINVYCKFKADLRGVTAWNEYMCFYAQPASAKMPNFPDRANEWTCAGASCDMTSSALEFDFSLIHTNL